MKKTVLKVSVLCMLLLLLAGCSQNTEYSQDISCVVPSLNKEVSLSESDKEYIASVLNSNTWSDGFTDCIFDYIFKTQKEEIRYSSSCGTFNDYTNKRYLILGEDQRQKINDILNVEELMGAP